MGTAPAVTVNTASAAPPTPALLVIDMQNALVAIAHRASATVAAVAGLQARARAAGAPDAARGAAAVRGAVPRTGRLRGSFADGGAARRPAGPADVRRPDGRHGHARMR
ncbi:hypothetical protein BF14_020700 [Streptomyces griseus]|nr:hypothetical protein BF14_020700 [Streptomyces griseus]